jgi:hypothetical protein
MAVNNRSQKSEDQISYWNPERQLKFTNLRTHHASIKKIHQKLIMFKIL